MARTTPHDRKVWIALLRGVNVGRGNPLGMADLRQALETAGFHGVVTIGRSGNVVASTANGSVSTVADRIADAVASVLGKRVGVVMRTAAQLATVVNANPIKEASADGSKLHVMFLEDRLGAQERSTVERIDAGSDVVRLSSREIYVWYRNGMSGSETAAQLARAVTTGATDRNWNTVVKLLAAARSVEERAADHGP